ncbi:MAG: 3-deoxy-8-phosphooctulonate synthase [Vampirovibrionales bacterium]|nr:3-deoxy-8-phosphooctulonate synthase [Vampirovibrionales bacterium]
MQKRFTVIAGPCVLEHQRGENNRQAARKLKALMASFPEVDFYFKSSFDKANRTSVDGYRGPGLEEGLAILKEIKDELGVKLLSDIHEIQQVGPVAEVVDMLQIPAFLCRQTDLLLEAGKSGKAVNIKKGQFMAPQDMIHAADKILHAGNKHVYITERGSTFGYNNLVVDMRSIPITHSMGFPLIFDATHSVQIPGGQGTSSGGKRDFAPVLARAAVAAGCDGLFFETHPNPNEALSDGPNQIPLDWVEDLLKSCLAIRAVIAQDPLHQRLENSFTPTLSH